MPAHQSRAAFLLTFLLSLLLVACFGGKGGGGGGGNGGGGGGENGAPVLSLTKMHQGNFTQGQQNATYTVTLSNTGGTLFGGLSVSEALPPGLTFVSMAGNGWTCTNPQPNLPFCQRNDQLAGGASYPPITVTVNVAADATSPQINQVHATGPGNATAADPTTILPAGSSGTAVVGTSVPFPIFAGDPTTSIAVAVTNDVAGDALTASLTVDSNTGAACTPATCGTIGSVSGVSGSGNYTLSYTPPLSPGFTTQTVPTLLVSSSLPGSFAATDYIEVDPAGTHLVDFVCPGFILVGSAQRTCTATVYNDVTHAGVTFAPLTASGYACSNIGTNSCGTLGTASPPVVSGNTTTTTITYTPPALLPSTPYDRPRMLAKAVADNTQFGSTLILISSTALTNTGLRISPGNKINSAVPGGAATTVNANIGNDTGNNRTVNWTLTAGGANCSPTCGTLGTPTVTGNGTFVSSAVTYTPPARYPGVAADQTPTITATSVDNPAATDSFTFTIADEACGTGNESVLNGQYAFLLRGSGANAGYAAVIGSFTADGAGHITGGLVDENTGLGPFTGMTIVTSGSSYSVGSDNRACLTLTDNVGDLWNFRAGVGTLVSNVATQGRIILFNDDNGRRLRLSGVLIKRDTTSFSLGAISGNYALGFEGVDSSGGRLAGAGVFTPNGAGGVSNLTLDIDDSGGLGTNLTGGTGSYTVDTTTGRGTLTTTISAPGPGGVLTPVTTNFVVYIVSPSEILDISTDSLLAGKPIQSGESRQQTVSNFSPTALDNGGYVFYTVGLDTSNGGNDTQIGQASVTTNGSATVTIDENDNGTPKPERVENVVLSIAANGRTTIPGTPGTSVTYLIGPSSGFIVGTDPIASFGFVEKQTGGPFSTNSISGPFFVGGDAPTTGSPYQSGTVTFDGVGGVTGNGDESGPNGLKKDIISGTYSFSNTSTPQGKGTVGDSIAYAISSSKIVFTSAGHNPEASIVQK